MQSGCFTASAKTSYLPRGEGGYKSSQVLLLWVSKELWEKWQLLAIHRTCVISLIRRQFTVNFFFLVCLLVLKVRWLCHNMQPFIPRVAHQRVWGRTEKWPLVAGCWWTVSVKVLNFPAGRDADVAVPRSGIAERLPPSEASPAPWLGLAPQLRSQCQQVLREDRKSVV